MRLRGGLIIDFLLLVLVSLCSSLQYDQCEKGDSIFAKSEVRISVSGAKWEKIFKVNKHNQCMSKCHLTSKCKSILVNETTCVLKDVNRMFFNSQISTNTQMEYYEKQPCPLPPQKFIAMVSDVKDCKDIYSKGWKINGVYAIPKTPGGNKYQSMLCEMTLLGGGWTVIQRRIDGSVDFNQNWATYKKGFGKLNGNFWFGLDRIHNLTRLPGNEILIPFETESGAKYYPMYDEFMVADEDDDYQLTVGSKVDVLGTSLTEGEGLDDHNQLRFSTPGNDNDNSERHCASSYSSGWWFGNCWGVFLNGVYGEHSDRGIGWDEFNINEPFRIVRMLVRRK